MISQENEIKLPVGLVEIKVEEPAPERVAESLDNLALFSSPSQRRVINKVIARLRSKSKKRLDLR